MTERNPANCPHGVAMDIYCEKCEMFNPPLTADKLLAVRKNMRPLDNVGTIENEIKLLDAVTLGVWNAAIEAAANYADLEHGQRIGLGIRKLKKDIHENNKGYWACPKCGKLHTKDFVCSMI